MEKLVDIVIVGSGLIGASLAHGLSGNFSYKIIDPKALNIDNNNNIAIAISHTSKVILNNLGLWQQHKFKIIEFIKELQVLQNNKFGSKRIVAQRYGLEYLGAVVPMNDLNNLLSANLQENFINSAIEGFTYNNKLWDLKLSNGQKLQTRLLIAADGSNSYIRNKSCFNTINLFSKKQAIVCNIEVQQPLINCAVEIHCASGIVSLLPFGNNKLKCIWTLESKLAQQYLALSNVEYIKLLNTILKDRFGKIIDISECITYKLATLKATEVYAPGVVLLGNAAQTMYPVTAQGFNLGLRDVAWLIELLIHNKNKFYNLKVLQNYAKKRILDREATMYFTQLVDSSEFKDLFINLPFSSKVIFNLGLGYYSNLPQLALSGGF